MNLPKPWSTVAKALAGIGALNVGLNEFVNFNILGFVPEGIFATVAIAAVGLSGVYVLMQLYQKKI